jgi:hypothetical protein
MWAVALGLAFVSGLVVGVLVSSVAWGGSPLFYPRVTLWELLQGDDGHGKDKEDPV